MAVNCYQKKMYLQIFISVSKIFLECRRLSLLILLIHHQVVLGPLYVKERQHPPAAGSTATAAVVLPLVPVGEIPRFSNVPVPKNTTSSPLLTATAGLTDTAGHHRPHSEKVSVLRAALQCCV